MTITGTGKTFRVSAMQHAFQEFAGSLQHWPRLVLLLLVGCCAGCYTTQGPILSTTQPNVIVFRGKGGYFPQLAEFEESLLEEGACPTVAYPEAHRRIAERVIAARNTGRLQGPLVIVGYSSGADKALSVSRQLAQRGIPVDKLVLLEAPPGGRVSGNVRECVNIYKPQPWSKVFPYFSGSQVMAESSATQLVNYNVREFNDGRYDGDDHFTLTANPFIQDMMIDEVMTAFESVPEQEETAVAGDAGRNQYVTQVVPPPSDD